MLRLLSWLSKKNLTLRTVLMLGIPFLLDVVQHLLLLFLHCIKMLYAELCALCVKIKTACEDESTTKK